MKREDKSSVRRGRVQNDSDSPGNRINNVEHSSLKVAVESMGLGHLFNEFELATDYIKGLALRPFLLSEDFYKGKLNNKGEPIEPS